MLTKFTSLKNRLLNGGDLASTFLRSTLSSQLASWIDMGTGFILFAFCHLSTWLSTALGALGGGILNCIINYRFTFHASAVAFKAVAVKYLLIWTGSVLFNSWGTQGLYILLGHLPFLEDLGFKPNGYYAAARLTASLVVSIFWNFLMQKNFVYRVTRFDPYCIRFVNFLIRTRSPQQRAADETPAKNNETK